MRLRFLAGSVLLFACSSSSSSPPEPPLTNATTLSCPVPGNLPFRLASSGFQNADNATLAASDTRIKDQASDAIGNPGGSSANIYLDDTASPASEIADYRGLKARTTQSGGLTSTSLPGEFVSLWTYDDTSLKWMTLGRTQTDANGAYDIAATLAPAPGTPVYAMLEGDGSCAEHYDYLLAPGSKVVVADIDGTLTTSNDELFNEISDGTYVPKMMTEANVLMQTWASKKYTVIYLTARAHLFRAETRQWLEGLSFPTGTVLTSNVTLASDAATVAYKSLWLSRMVKDFGWIVVAAYGNEDTDIEAYQSVNIPNADIFIIGPSGGDLGSTAVPNNDYTAHIKSFVDAQPDND